jgi:transcriptional regulator with XRE-family HTH domain
MPESLHFGQFMINRKVIGSLPKRLPMDLSNVQLYLNGQIVQDCFSDVNYYLCRPWRAMDLAEFVRLKMEEKNLSKIDIERNSDRMLTDTHVATVLAGKAKNPTLKVLLGLAKALDVPPTDVFKAAAEIDDGEEAWDAQSIALAIQKLLRLKPREIREIKRVLKIR